MKRILFSLILSFVSISFSQTVILDNTFGTNGKTTTRFQNLDALILSSRIQTDGKIIVFGSRLVSMNFQSYDMLIGRYNVDGSIDTSFGTNGFISIEGLDVDGTGQKMLLLQPDGKIVVTGSKYGNSNRDFHTYRFNSNGTPDTTFGNNGVIVTDINSSADNPTAVVILPDNKIVVLGTYGDSGFQYLCAVRYSAEGIIDTSFGVNGKSLFGSLEDNYSDKLMDVILEPNGKIVLGANHDVMGDNGDFVLAKLNANGTIDTGFGTNGVRITNFGADEYLLSIQKINGKYYAFGGSEDGQNQSQMAISRYSTSGSLDFSFGTNGKVLLSRNSTAQFDAIADARLVGDKIICVGVGESEDDTNPFNLDALLIRLNLDGTLDTTFNNTGYVLSDFSIGNRDMFITLEIQTDGKILALGSSYVVNEDSFLLTRYTVNELSTANYNNHNFSAYPNPFLDKITIKSEDINLINATAELFDMNGRKLSTYTIKNNDITIYLDKNLSSGNYFLKITNEGKTETLKIVKK